MINSSSTYFNTSSSSSSSSVGVINITVYSNHTLEATPELLVTCLVLLIIVFMTICGNVLVLLAIWTDHHLRTPTYCFMSALAIADLLLGTIVLPFSSAVELLEYWPFGSTLCDIWLATDVFCCTASIYLVLAISVDRYIGVTRPLKYNIIMTKRRAYVTIVFVWTLSLLVSIVPFLGWKKRNSPGVCEVNDNVEYALFSASFSFYVPLVIILIVYWRIYKEARKQLKFLRTGMKTTSKSNGNQVVLRVHVGRGDVNRLKIKDDHSMCRSERASFIDCEKHSTLDSLHSFNQQNKFKNRACGDANKCIHSDRSLKVTGKLAKFKREQKAAKTLAIVVGCFILCWMPFFVLLPIVSFCKSCNIPEQVFKIFFWLGYCNSLMNPMIYAFSSMEIRKAYKRLFKCGSFINDQKIPSNASSHLNKCNSLQSK